MISFQVVKWPEVWGWGSCGSRFGWQHKGNSRPQPVSHTHPISLHTDRRQQVLTILYCMFNLILVSLSHDFEALCAVGAQLNKMWGLTRSHLKCFTIFYNARIQPSIAAFQAFRQKVPRLPVYEQHERRDIEAHPSPWLVVMWENSCPRRRHCGMGSPPGKNPLAQSQL